MRDHLIDPRQKAILHSAWEAFATYGFRKTSMDDIARGSGMSRTALYLHFKNKEDIYRSLVQFYYDDACEAVAEALASDGSVETVLHDAFEAQAGQIMEKMLSSPHGLELMDAGHSMAKEVAEEGEARLTALYAQWLVNRIRSGAVRSDVNAHQAADTMTAALKGIKSQCPAYPVFQKRLSDLAQLFGRGLEAR
ncbi:MAG: TetR/AcrR family transcriptional regulator [Pseudomonadota bacterium]